MSTNSTKRFSSTDQVGDHEHQIHQDRERGGIDEAEPEISSGGLAWHPGDDLAQLKKLDHHDDGDVDRAPYKQIGRERKTAKPGPYRRVQHEQFDASDADGNQQPVRYSRHHGDR
jgi:hypothetical protein